MKSEQRPYTETQRAAIDLYRTEQDRLRALDSQAEELLSEGNFTLRSQILKNADHLRSSLEGMRRMAEAMGFPHAALLKAVREAAKDSPSA